MSAHHHSPLRCCVKLPVAKERLISPRGRMIALGMTIIIPFPFVPQNPCRHTFIYIKQADEALQTRAVRGVLMSTLEISLFGSVQVHRNGHEVKLTRISQTLLAYLMLYRHRPHHRDTLANLLWGDRSEDRARSCLSTALWRLRRVLEEEASGEAYLITTPTGEIQFNPESACWLDVAVFEGQVNRTVTTSPYALTAAEAEELWKALHLYTGELMEGFYDDWVVWERERLRLLYVRGLMCLMRYYKHHGAYEESLLCGRRILHLDPLREEVHREMMRLYMESGQRALAARQYEICREVLTTELNVAPMPETQALYAAVIQQAPQYDGAPEPASFEQALHQLQQAVRALEEAREVLQRAVRLVAQFVPPQDPERHF